MSRKSIDWVKYAAQHHAEQQEKFRLAQDIIYFSRPWHQLQQRKHPLHPAVVAALKFAPADNWQQLLLEWPHVDQTDVTRLAYIRNERAGETDRPTSTSLGKYLRQHWPNMLDHHIRDYVAKYATVGEFRIERTTEAIVDAVQNGPSSCMQWESDDDIDDLGCHPYEVYAPCYGWHMATRYEGSRIMGRALLMQRDNDEAKPKYFVRAYRRKDDEDYSQPDDELIQWLKSQGYEHRHSWGGSA